MSERQAKATRRAARKAAQAVVLASWGEIVKPKPWWLPANIWWVLIGLLLNVKRPRSR